MTKLNVLTKLGKAIEGNLPAIFTGVAIGGVFLTGAAGYFAAKKTDKVIATVKDEGCAEPTLEIIKRSWKYYVPVAAAAGVTIGAVIGLNVEHKKAYAALLAAYTTSQGDLKSLKDEVKQLLGDEKAKELEDNLAESKIKDAYADKAARDILGKDDPHKVEKIIDKVTGAEFMCSKVAIVAAADMVNQMLASESSDSGFGQQTYLDFLDYLGKTPAGEVPEMWRHVCWKLSGNNPVMRVEFDGEVDENFNTITTFSYDFDYVDVPDDERSFGGVGIRRHSYNHILN